MSFGEPRETLVFVAGDFDGDGDDDAVMQSRVNGIVRWELHRNRGEGVFVPEPIAGALPGVQARTAAVGDFDGNGALDVVVAHFSGFSYTTVELLLNNGTGAFVSSVMPVQFDLALQVLPLDVDGDSDLDLVLANGAGYGPVVPSRLLQNDGTGAFTDVTATLMPNPAAQRTSVAALDVDGDGLVDLVFDEWPLFVMRRNPGGGFTAAPGSFATGMAGIRAIDVDSDGDLDLVGLRSNLLVVQRNDGLGVFTVLQHPVPSISGVHPADVDGDGDVDFLTNSLGNTAVRLWRTDPGFLLTEITTSALPPLEGSVEDGAFFDSDGDGDLDFWFPSVGPLLHNDGTGRFLDYGDAMAAVAFDRPVAVTDIDGDGHVDIVGLDTGAPVNTGMLDLAWWRNDGTGRFALATVLAQVPVCSASKVVAFDMDGDGDEDVWSLRCGTDRVWRNDGGGVLTEVTATAFPIDTRNDHTVLVRDYDGDGDLDAFVVRDYLFDSLYVNQGNGTFADLGATRLTDDELTLDAAALDFDLDGDVDLVLVNSPTPLRMFENDGNGSFADVSAARLPPVNGPLSHVLAIDADGDGDDDLVVTRSTSTALLRNDGGTFVFSNQLPSWSGTSWPQAVDFDLDGDPDLLLGTRWFVNDGAGNFAPSAISSAMPAASLDRTRVFADVDGDGDEDIVQGALRYNLHRQLEDAIPPRRGLHGEVRLHAASSSPAWSPLAVLFFSDRLAPPLALGVFGELYLDPARLALLSSHVVPAQPGYAAARYPVPNQPGLVGAKVPLQALIVDRPTRAHSSNAIVLEVR